MNSDFMKSMNLESLFKSLSNLKNMKPSASGSAWPSISNSSTFQMKSNQIYASQRNIPEEAISKAKEELDRFNALKKSTESLLDTYENNRVNSINLLDSHDNYIEENEKLKKQLANTSSDIQTNDRKTFYQNEASESLDSYYWILLSVYIVTVVGFAVCWYLLPTTMSNPKLLFLFICLILYPLFSTRILQYIMYLYNLLLDFLPKNMYNQPN